LVDARISEAIELAKAVKKQENILSGFKWLNVRRGSAQSWTAL
jgi:hypothetical protein